MKDRRDSWAAAENIIPSSSGAARALAFIWQGLKITGKAYRVPTRTGSIAELNLLTEKSGDRRSGQRCLPQGRREAPLKGVMGVLEDEWASSRIVGDPHSSIVDLPLTAVQGELLSVAAWYDNEMGYSTRLAEMAAQIAAGSIIAKNAGNRGLIRGSLSVRGERHNRMGAYSWRSVRAGSTRAARVAGIMAATTHAATMMSRLTA